MISLIRIALIMLIIYLIQRAFTGKKSTEGGPEAGTKIHEPNPKKNKLPKEIGEYVDYEDVKD